MKVIKKINNNVAICLDNNNHELIAFGKGIGFKPCPYELTDLNLITRTYYGVSSRSLELFNVIPEEIFEISAKIVDIAKSKLDCEINSNIAFTLADHIHFAIERMNKNIHLKMPLLYDIQHMYPVEMEIGQLALKLIFREMNIRLPKEEANSIALHFINAETNTQQQVESLNIDEIIEQITMIIELYYHINIDKDSFNYSRFVTHLQYLFKRKETGNGFDSENSEMFEDVRNRYPKTYECVKQISMYLEEKIDWNPSEEEQLYLMLHLNRLCAREDCYR